MTVYVAIAINIPTHSGVFHYHLPPELEGQVQIGQLVQAPFGRQMAQGVVVGFPDRPEVQETRAIEGIIDPAAVVTPLQITFAQALAEDWLSTLAAGIALMLPPGVSQQADQLYTAHGRLPEDVTVTGQRLLKLLYERGPLRGQQIDRAMPRINWRTAAQVLKRKGLLSSEPVLQRPRVRPKMGRTVSLAVSPEQAEAALPDLGRAGSEAIGRRQAILRVLIADPGPLEVAWLYAESGGRLEDLRYLSERGLVRMGEMEVLRDPLSTVDIHPYEAPILTRAQQAAWTVIEESLLSAFGGNPQPPLLLHGVTGSGKTEVYLRAVQKTLELGRQALVLVPEIALTPQTIQRFAGRFPGQVGVLHSALSDGERYDTWRRARQGDLGLVVGPRSALFTPLERLGLIVVDECHDDSYYQSEAPPYYHAREAAVRYAGLAGAVCLLGSATPDLTSMYRAEAGRYRYLQLPARILAHRQAVEDQLALIEKETLQSKSKRGRKSASGVSLEDSMSSGTSSGLPGLAGHGRYQPFEGQAQSTDLPPVSVVDMREELKAGNRSIFSRLLQEALADVLDRGRQAILFLNRRGSATYVFCRDCGYTLKCPRCDIPLTFHEAVGELRCHYCSYTRRMPSTCPQCGSARIRHFGTGTQRVEADVQELFPGVRTLRWDHETTRHKGAHQEILDRFSSHQADLLVGTQMLAKGLDLPLVTLVGVVLADVGLNLPDFRSGERTFQVLTQVAGRAGRSLLGGQVILQTFQPEHYVIRAAAGHDYAAFYRQEVDFRRQAGYPPFAQLVRFEIRTFEDQKAGQAAEALAARLRRLIDESNRRQTRLIGPAPCFFGRVGGLFRWQVALVGPDPLSLVRGQDFGEWKIEVNPTNLL